MKHQLSEARLSKILGIGIDFLLTTYGNGDRRAQLGEALWGVAQSDFPVTDEFGCRIFYVDYGRATIKA